MARRSPPSPLVDLKNHALRLFRARREAGETGGGIRLDGIYNPVTGFGTAQDKTSYSRFDTLTPLTDEEISALVHGNAMAGRIVDAWPEEMLREDYHLDTGSEAANDYLIEQHEDLEVRAHLIEGMRWGRAWGGAAILLGADDGRPSHQPLRPERVQALRYLYTVDRRFLSPMTYYTDPGSRKLGEPETYMVQATTAHGSELSQIVHESRMILFGGAPTAPQERTQLGGWTYSVLQKPYEALIQFDTAWQAVSTMLTDSNQAIWKMQGLAEAISSGEEDALKERMRMTDLFRSIMKSIVVDAGDGSTPAESFERQSVSFADIPNVLEKIITRLSGASLIPVSILLGSSPTGMNATGDNDFRGFYDKIVSSQKNDLAPKLRHINRIILSAKASPYPFVRTKVTYDPLWTLDPLRGAQKTQAEATAASSFVSAGVYLPEEIALNAHKTGAFPLSKEAVKAREAALKESLEVLAEGTPGEAEADQGLYDEAV